MSFDTPILFLIFNRPDKTSQAFEILREIRPRQLFLAADGPRKDHPEDVEKCARTRKIVDRIDWECNIQTLFRNENLGCRAAVSSAIDWFFSSVEEGIILEDDCVPSMSFFRFCQELLGQYRDNPEVMVVSGDNYQDERWKTEDSYYFSRYPHCWGWASWRRAWTCYDNQMSAWPVAREQGLLAKASGNDSSFVNYWQTIFDKVHACEIDSWAYVWTFCCMANEGLTVIPAVNLVRNIGFDDEATHTVYPNEKVEARLAQELNFPLRHPSIISRNRVADLSVDMFYFGIGPERAVPLIHRAISRVMTPLRALLNRVSSLL